MTDQRVVCDSPCVCERLFKNNLLPGPSVGGLSHSQPPVGLGGFLKGENMTTNEMNETTKKTERVCPVCGEVVRTDSFTDEQYILTYDQRGEPHSRIAHKCDREAGTDTKLFSIPSVSAKFKRLKKLIETP